MQNNQRCIVQPFFQTPGVTLYQGDCLEVMPTLETGSFDCIIADLPYGTTACGWDSVIPFEPLWEQYRRLIKPNGAIVLFGSQPFTSELVMSNRKWFKYCWVWDKIASSGVFSVQKRPLKQHEDICVFSCGASIYNPQMRKGVVRSKGGGKVSDLYSKTERTKSVNDSYFPTSIIKFSSADLTHKKHPTQKPIALLSYLIRTYSNVSDRILDNTAGSFTTGVAAVETGRQFTGIELSPEYCAIGQKRIEEALLKVESMLIKPWELEAPSTALQGEQINLFEGEPA